MNKISAVYKFTNTITGDFYIGSRKNIKKSLANNKYQSVWIAIPNEQLYQDIQKYGVDKFAFEILAEVEPDKLKEVEQEFIETLKPTYNQMNAKDLDIDKRKEYQKEYKNQLCLYNDETLTLNALSKRFRKQGIDHPTIEAKESNNPIEFYDDMYEAIDYYLRLGFTPEVICNQIEFGCLNVDSSEIRRLYNIYKRR